MADTVEPTLSEDGHETHPAFGMIAVHRGQVSPPGSVLFDSELRHGNVIALSIARGRRKRDLNRDWLYRDKELLELEFSEAQWASLVSAVGQGSGVPCTIRQVGYERQPNIPYAPRLKQSVDETTRVAERMYQEVREAFRVAEEKPTKANLRALGLAIGHVGPNVRFAAESLIEHVETTVTKARADIEATVAQHAERLGIDAAGYTAPLALGPGTDDEDEEGDPEDGPLCGFCGVRRPRPGFTACDVCA